MRTNLLDNQNGGSERSLRITCDLRETTELPPWRLISTREVSRLLGVSIQALANWRLRGKGPQFVGAVRGKGNKVFYRKADLEVWVAKQQGQSKEPWVLVQNWLAERGVTLENPTPEGVWWLAEQVDKAFP